MVIKLVTSQIRSFHFSNNLWLGQPISPKLNATFEVLAFHLTKTYHTVICNAELMSHESFVD